MKVLINWNERYSKVLELVNSGLNTSKAIKEVCGTKGTNSFYSNISDKQLVELNQAKMQFSQGMYRKLSKRRDFN